MKSIILIVLVNLLSLTAWSQISSQVTQKDINKALAIGKSCCEKVDKLDSIIINDELIIEKQQAQIGILEYRYDQKSASFIFADSMYKYTEQQRAYYESEFNRVKAGKKNWIVATLTTIGAVAAYLIITNNK